MGEPKGRLRCRTKRSSRRPISPPVPAGPIPTKARSTARPAPHCLRKRSNCVGGSSAWRPCVARCRPAARSRRTMGSRPKPVRASCCRRCSATATRSSYISGCMGRSGSGRARCAHPSSAPWTCPPETSCSACRSPSSDAPRSSVSWPSSASGVGATSRSTRRRTTISHATIPGSGGGWQRMAGAGGVHEARGRRTSVLVRRTRWGNRGSRPGPTGGARPHAALEHPRPHTRRARHRLVSQARLLNGLDDRTSSLRSRSCQSDRRRCSGGA